MRERGISFKEALNQAVRTRLLHDKQRRSRKFVQKSFAMKEEFDFRWDKGLLIAEAMEDEEVSRKLSSRK
jgi:hypothetical protein